MLSKTQCETLSKLSAVGLVFSIPISILLMHLLLFVLVLSWLFSGNIVNKVKDIVHHPIARAALFLYLLFVVGAFYALAPVSDTIDFLKKMSKLLYIPFLIPLMQEAKWRRYAFIAFIAAMLLTFTLGTAQYIYNNLGYPQIGRHWGACFFKDHIYTSLMAAVASFFLGHYACNETKTANKIVWFSLTAGAVYFLFFLCDGRSGYVIFALLWTLFFIQRSSHKNLIFSLISLGALLGILFMYSGEFQDRLLLLVSETEEYQLGDATTSTGARLEYIEQTLALIKEHPWFGWGTGSFKTIYQEHAKLHHLKGTHNPHNEYLLVLSQLGVVGLFGLLTLFFSILKNSFRLPNFEKWLAQGMLGTMVVGCMINSWLMDATSGYFFVVMVAICFGGLELKRSQHEANSY